MNEPIPITYSPATEEETSDILRECSQKAQKVRIRGGGTKDWLGNPYAPTPVVVSTARLDGLVDYQPEDLTITVGAGMPFARLQEILAAQGQFLPLDPPDLPGQTVGGLLATNRSGPRRLLYGTARDLLIGCRFVLADGSIGHSGGRVVKNVAGYDLHKLFIGAMGTLGLLTEVTFKVVPRPQAVGVGIAFFKAVENVTVAARSCVRSNLMPAALEILVAEPQEYQLYFGAEGTRIAVESQLEGLAARCRENMPQDIQIQPLEEGEKIWQSLSGGASRDFKDIILKVSTTLTDLPRVIKDFEVMSTLKGLNGLIQVQAGTGVAYFHALANEPNFAAVGVKIIELRKELVKVGGSLVVERAPAELKRLVDVWGDRGDAGPVMRTLKQKLDPQGLLNPSVMDMVG